MSVITSNGKMQKKLVSTMGDSWLQSSMHESKKSKEECTWLGGNYLDNEKEWDWIDGMALHKLGLERKCRCECGDGKFKSNT